MKTCTGIIIILKSLKFSELRTQQLWVSADQTLALRPGSLIGRNPKNVEDIACALKKLFFLNKGNDMHIFFIRN